MGGWRKRMASPDIDVAAELGTNLTAARQTAEMQPDQPAALLWIFLLLNLAAFGAYWWDKRAAAEGRWRVSERTLLLLAFIGGSIGAVTAKNVLRHKAPKRPLRTTKNENRRR